jgi:hypothetical protein
MNKASDVLSRGSFQEFLAELYTHQQGLELYDKQAQ